MTLEQAKKVANRIYDDLCENEPGFNDKDEHGYDKKDENDAREIKGRWVSIIAIVMLEP